jgi:dienelactone hydrolase
LERIAAAGFVVAAPAHVGNTQDDARIDHVNDQARLLGLPGPVLPCRDGLSGPCSRTSVPLSMADRVRDISATLDQLRGWLGHRVDAWHAGVMGHSRGTVSALAAAGGSAPWGTGPTEPLCQPVPDSQNRCWPLDAEPRVAAIMGMAIGGPRVTRGAGLANVTVPTLLVAGELDRTSLPSVSQLAHDTIASRHKALLVLDGAVHRSFDSTYCDQTQAAGAIAQSNPLAILDRHTFDGIVRFVGMSGTAMEYCRFETFTQPVDIRPLVAETTDPDFLVTEDNVPSTGLEADEVEGLMAKLAATFFGVTLRHRR